MATLSVPAERMEASTSSSTFQGPPSPAGNASADIEGDGRPDVKGKGKETLVKQESHRIMASCAGAIVTTLTMTPFDVIKTRLQTQSQAESMFIPSSRVPPPSQAVVPPSSSSQSRSSRAKGKQRAAPSVHPTGTMQHARSLAATNLATCCQKTYFTTNLAEAKDILCRFDPRGSVAPSTAPSIAMNAGGSAALVIDSSQACLYPSPALAAEQLPHLSAPSSRHFTGFLDALIKIPRHEGIPALWRGVSTSLLMAVPSQVIYMVGYDTLRTTALSKAPQQFISTKTNRPTSQYIATTTFLAGSASRTAVAVLLAPLELFRTRLQSTGTHVSLRTVSSSVVDLVRKQGTLSLWRGLSATLWRDVPFSGIYWAGYEGFKRILSAGKGMGEVVHGEHASKTFSVAFTSGAASGMVASFLTHPFDVIKTRKQTEAAELKSRSTMQVFKEIGQKEGLKGLWRGMGPRIAKVAPACGIMIGSYEMGLRWTGEAKER